MNQQFLKMLAYDRWATLQLLHLCEQSPDLGRAIELLAHCIAAQYVWISRLGLHGKSMPVWPTLTSGEIRDELAQLDAIWSPYLAALDHAELSRVISYTSTFGSFQQSVADTLLHVFNHGTHHRGQVMLLLRSANINVPFLDYVEAVRRGYLAVSPHV